MYRVELIDIERFKNSRDAWNTLVASMKMPSIFCTWEWIYTWWVHFGKKYEPLILFIYKNSSLAGILPLAIHKSSNLNLLRGNALSYCGSNELGPDQFDIISSNEDAGQCINAVFNFLSTEYKDWDVLLLSLISEESNLISFLNKDSLTFDVRIREASIAPFIPLTGTFEEYINSFDKKQRYNIRSRRKKLYEDHGIKYESCDSSKEYEGLKDLFYLHGERAKRKDILSSFEKSDSFKFHNDLVQTISNNGWVSLRFLRNEKEVVAASYNFVFGGQVFSYQKGLSPAWERYGPGAVLVYELIREAFLNGNKEYNFLQGGEEYKKQWTQKSRVLYTATIFNKTVYANLLKTYSTFKTFIKKNLIKSKN